MRTLLKALVFFFNLFAITNVKLNKDTFVPSKPVILKNICILVVLLLTLNYSVPSSYSDVTQTSVKYNRAALSVLYIFVFSLTIIQYRMITVVLVFFQILQQKRVVKLLNELKVYAEKNVTATNFSHFAKDIIGLLITSITLLLVCYSVEFAAFFSPSFQELARSFWFHIHGAMTYFFVLFVSLILKFILFLLDNLFEKVKRISNNQTRHCVNKILLEFEIIQGFTAEVENIFGFILTFVMFCTMILMISKVILNFYDIKGCIFTNFVFE